VSQVRLQVALVSRRPELWGLSEVARAAGVTPQAVSNWRRRSRDFPAPLAELAQGPVWSAPVARAWLRRNGKLRR
jgi:transcriptional regulator with XRE-family HTH domain